MTGDLHFDDAYCFFMTGHNCTVDNVDVSDLYDTVQAIGTNLTDDFVNVSGDFMTNDLRLRSGSDVRFFSDAAESSPTASIDGATGNGFLGGTLTITPNKRFYLDGGPTTANGGDTFISQIEDNETRFYAGGVYSFTMSPTINGSGVDFAVAGNKKFYLDGGPGAPGGGDTYLFQTTDNEMRFYSGGTYAFVITPALSGFGTDLSVAGNKKFFLDGGVNAANGGDTYLFQTTDNEMRFYSGGTYVFVVTPALSGFGTDLSVAGNKKFFLDGGVNAANGGDTYLYQPGDNEMRFYAGGTYAFAVTPTLVGTGTDFAIASGKKLYLDSASSTYVSAPAANVMNFAVGSDPQVMQLTPTGATITSGNDLTMSGGNIAMAPLKTVDGVDVSELKNTVDTFINTSPSSSQAAFAYGRATFNNGNQSYPTLCAGFNINGNIANECRFLTPASNNAYLVMFTPVSDALNPCTSLRLFTASPLQSGFNLFNACVGSGSRPTVVNFVVYAQ